MKKKNRLLNYLRMKGVELIELMNHYYGYVFYGCLFFNLIIIVIIFYKKLLLLGYIFSITLLIVINMNKMIEAGKINLYGDTHKKILYLNLVLLMLNIINIFFNVFRYIFYDIIKIIREYARNLLLNYFNYKIDTKIDFYIDNILAYVSFDVVGVTIVLTFYLFISYIGVKYFDGEREEILIKNDELKANLFGTHRSTSLCIIYIYSLVFLFCFFIVAILKQNNIISFDIVLFNILTYVNMLSTIVFLTYTVQFEYNYYKFHGRKNKEYLKGKK